MFGSDSSFGNSSPLGGGPSPLDVWGYGAQPEPDPIQQLQSFIPPTPAGPVLDWEQPGFQDPYAFVSGLPGKELEGIRHGLDFLLEVNETGSTQIGEKVVVLGQGIVGLLTTALLAQYPLALLATLDRYPLRRRWSRGWRPVRSSWPAVAAARWARAGRCRSTACS